ncbi:MAG: DUF192 domain-containing protein [Candidatus Nealsonbacteria bacterium]|nr:DUF192 domain-containing protein [Candidatus Nealsonbacteria bacterium]
MMKIIGGFVALLAMLSFFAHQEEEASVCFERRCFNVEVASDEEARRKGLMFREKLDDNRGMLFVFEDSGLYDFWMKNTSMVLDIIWIDEDGRVVYVSENAEPCSTTSCAPILPDKAAKYVLEIKGGLVSELNIKEGGIANLRY